MKKTVRLKKELKTRSPSRARSLKLLASRVSCAMIDKQGTKVGTVGSSMSGKIIRVSAGGARTDGCKVSAPGAEEGREDIEFPNNVIDYRWRPNYMLGR